MTNIPDAKTTVAEIQPLNPSLWEALEHAIGITREHFGDDPIDGSLGSHMVRHHAREFLTSKGFLCETLALSGIAFKWNGFYIRVLKSDEGLLPAPNSEEREKFYRQEQLLLSFEEGEATLDPDVNLVVLWDAERDTFANLTLILACPKTADRKRQSVVAHWYEPLDHPSTGTGSTGGNSGGPQSGPDFDLDIRDLPDESTGNGENESE